MKTNRMQLMSEGDVSKSLFKLGIPMVVSMLVTALYNVVDTYFVSGLGTQQVAAVSVAFPISFIFSGIGLTFGVGAGSYISRLLGKQDMEKAHQVASTAMFSSVLTSIIAAGIIYAMLTPVLTFMGATETIMPFAKKYAVIFIISTVFSAVNVTSGNLAVSQGASNISLTAMLTGAILNMVLVPILIYPFHLGVEGAAIATLISQIVTLGIYIRFFAAGKTAIKIGMSYFKPMAGFNYGAKNYPRLLTAIKSCIKWTTGFCIIFTMIIFLFASPLLSLFSNDVRVLEIAVPALRANTIMFFTFGLQFTYSTLYLAMGKALVGGILNVCRQGILFIPVIMVLPTIWGMNGVIYSQAVADLLTTFVTIYFAFKIHNQLKQAI